MVSKVREYTGKISQDREAHVIRIHNYCLYYRVAVTIMHGTLVKVSKVREYTGEISQHTAAHVIRIHNYCLCYMVTLTIMHDTLLR